MSQRKPAYKFQGGVLYLQPDGLVDQTGAMVMSRAVILAVLAVLETVPPNDYARGRNDGLEEAKKECREVCEHEFFHDGLSADLQDCKDKAHAYVAGWQEAANEIEAAIRALSTRPAPNTANAKDAARWRFARTILAKEDVRIAFSGMVGSTATEEENIKADEAIDEAMGSSERSSG